MWCCQKRTVRAKHTPYVLLGSGLETIQKPAYKTDETTNGVDLCVKRKSAVTRRKPR